MKAILITLFSCIVAGDAVSASKPDVFMVALNFVRCESCKDLGVLDSLFRRSKDIFSKPEPASILRSPRLSSMTSGYRFMLSGVVTSTGANCAIEYVFKDKDGEIIELPVGKFEASVRSVNQWKAWIEKVIEDVKHYRLNGKFKIRVGVMKIECRDIADPSCEFRIRQALSTMANDMNTNSFFKSFLIFEGWTEKHEHKLETLVTSNAIDAGLCCVENKNVLCTIAFKCNNPGSASKELSIQLWKSFTQ